MPRTSAPTLAMLSLSFASPADWTTVPSGRTTRSGETRNREATAPMAIRIKKTAKVEDEAEVSASPGRLSKLSAKVSRPPMTAPRLKMIQKYER